MNDKIKELERQIEIEKNKIYNCSHDFGEPFYNPTTKKESYGFKLEKQGSDCWTVPEGYHDVTVPRWTRKCKLCGKEEHTEKHKPIIKGQEPDFK